MNLGGHSPLDGLFFVGFNQEASRFCCGTDDGMVVYSCDPLKERFRERFGSAGIGYIEMLFRTSIFAIVGGGKNPWAALNKVMVWDDQQKKVVAELEFRSQVKSVRLRRDRIIVVLENKVFIYNFTDLKLLQQIVTVENPKGLCCVSTDASAYVLACPGLQKGYVHIELYDTKKVVVISAHDNNLTAMALNQEGTKLATASEVGTLLRIFNTQTGELIQELRRGMEKTVICSLSFSFDTKFICVSSVKGTVHVFAVVKEDAEPVTRAQSVQNSKSSLSFMKKVLPRYFSSEWSLAQFRAPEGYSMCAFSNEPNAFFVACANGTFYRCTFDSQQGGECKIEYAKPYWPLEDA
eukprot:TRINITY_DN9529_c0_g1_i1.p1 TRINITY_DN9529_c0_g1~~TRINITY_DN9529_c0_g1_i1.p1  ORF type:complete len:351 (+),score=66.11 TRINITY_DN9529_c0_g1_i1:61-1113(+)